MINVEFYRSLSPEDMNRLMTEFNRRMYDVGEARKHQSYNFAFCGEPRDDIDEIAAYIGQHLKRIGFLSSGHIVSTSSSHLICPYQTQEMINTEILIKKAQQGVLVIKDCEAIFNRPAHIISHPLRVLLPLTWTDAFLKPRENGISFMFEGIGDAFIAFKNSLTQNQSPINWEKIIEKTIHTDGKTTRDIIAEIDAIEDKAKPDPKYMPILFSPEKARAFLAKSQP